MGNSLLNVTWEDENGNAGVFGALIDDIYDDGVFAEVLAFLQDLVDASSCKITKATVARELDLSALTGNTVGTTDAFRALQEQLVIAFRDSAGQDMKISIPGALSTMYMGSGQYEGMDLDPDNALLTAIKATGITTPLLATRAGGTLAFRKGWRKGRKHS